MILFPLWLWACGGTPPVTPPPPPPPVAPAPAPAPHADPHADHHGSHATHMLDMARTRDALRDVLGAAYDQPVPGLDAADAAAGKQIYAEKCAACHGAEGKGDGPVGTTTSPPASDLTDAFHARFYSDAGRVHLIRNGSPGTAMAGFTGQLTDRQILDVYAHVRALRRAIGPK